MKEIKQVRRDGWSIDQNQFRAGITTIAAPVYNESQRVTYCLTSTMFTGQHDAETLVRIGQSVRDTAAQVSRGSYDEEISSKSVFE